MSGEDQEFAILVDQGLGIEFPFLSFGWKGRLILVTKVCGPEVFGWFTGVLSQFVMVNGQVLSAVCIISDICYEQASISVPGQILPVCIGEFVQGIWPGTEIDACS